jgi:hypothetical protein
MVFDNKAKLHCRMMIPEVQGAAGFVAEQASRRAASSQSRRGMQALLCVPTQVNPTSYLHVVV